MINFGKKRGFEQTSVWIQESLVFLICFFYLLFQVRPVLILEAQSPVFINGSDFISEFIKIPGGLTDWLSALFMQCWLSDFLGALLLTFCFWIVALLTRKWMETLTKDRPIHTYHLIPVGLLLVLQNHYDFRPSIVIALIINLICLLLFIRWAPKQQAIRSILGLMILLLLYWTTGGAFFTFAILCGLDEIFLRKQILSGILLLLVSAVLPLAASSSIFLVTLKQAYLHNMVFEDPVELWFIGYAFHAFFLIVLLVALISRLTRIRISIPKIAKLGYVWKWGAGILILVVGTVLLEEVYRDDIKQPVLQINRAVGEGRWMDVLETSRCCTNITPLVLSQTNLALYQTGSLLDSMFTYPQTKGSIGLLMNSTWCFSWPEEASNVAWKLGLVNEALHWAHEALEHKGPTPDILKRLGMAYMLKGENDAASHFFINLRNVPFQGNVAENLIRLNENPTELAKDSACNYIRSCMPIEDLVSYNKISSIELEHLLKRNPRNKMAFEYMIAYHLLNADIKEILENLPAFFTLNYSKIPRHMQEAVILAAATIPKFDLNQLRGLIDPINFSRFMEYRTILVKHQNNKVAARQELQVRFGNSYWYYLMFVKSASRLPESLNEFQ
jgi:hypothetical protein